LIEINAEERVNLPPQSYDYDSENSAEYRDDPVDYLADYGVTNGDIGKLREGGFYTVGQVQDASEQDLKRIRGIGKVKAARIKDAVDRYSEEEGDDFF
jgi:ERCC4-type nuclease